MWTATLPPFAWMKRHLRRFLNDPNYGWRSEVDIQKKKKKKFFFTWIFTDKFFTGLTVKTGIRRNFSLVFFFSLIRTKCKGHFTVRERLKGGTEGGRGSLKRRYSLFHAVARLFSKEYPIPGMLLANMNISNNDPFHHCFHSCTAFILRGVILPMEKMDSFKSNYYSRIIIRGRDIFLWLYGINLIKNAYTQV